MKYWRVVYFAALPIVAVLAAAGGVFYGMRVRRLDLESQVTLYRSLTDIKVREVAVVEEQVHVLDQALTECQEARPCEK